MKEQVKHLKAVVLDWAGTTVDHGSRAPAIVFQEIFRQRGVEITVAHARHPMGMAKRDHIAAIAAMPDISQAWTMKYGRARATMTSMRCIRISFRCKKKRCKSTAASLPACRRPWINAARWD